MINFIDGVLQPSLWFLVDWSLRWVLLILLLAAWLVVVRPRRSATRYLVCLLVLVAGLVLPALPRWGTGFVMPTAKLNPPTVVADLPQMPADSAPLSGRDGQASPKTLSGERPRINPTSADRAPANSSAGAIEPQPAGEPLGVRRITILSLAILWACGIGFLFARWVGSWLLLERMRRTAVPVQGSPSQLFQACRAQLGLGRQATLASHAAVCSPLTLGLHRPMILVPPSWTELPEQTQRGSLLHELAHLARYDDWVALPLELVRIVFFFHPLIHCLLNRIEYERELLCDETALAQGIDPRDYAGVLLEFSRQAGRLRPAFVGPSYPLGFGHRRTVKARINRLLEANMNRWMSPLPIGRAIALGTLVMGLALALGSFGASAIEPDSKESPMPAPAAPAVPQKSGESTKAPAPSVRRESTEIIPPKILDAKQPLENLNTVFDNKTGAPVPSLATDLAQNAIIVRGTPEQIKAVKDTLEALGEKASKATKTASKASAPFAEGKKESLTYGNKSFATWRAVLTTDLKPEVRIEAIKALSAFGANGYGKEAAEAILEVMRGYDTELWHPDETLVISAAPQAFSRIGSEGISALVNELKHGKTNGRRFAIFALTNNMGRVAKPAVSAVIEAFKDEDLYVRRRAMTHLRKIEPNPKDLVFAAIAAMKDADPEIRDQAVVLLSEMRQNAKPAVPALIAVIKDGDARLRSTALWALRFMEPKASDVLPAVLTALKDKDYNVRNSALGVLQSLGPEAKEAVPALIAGFKDADVNERAAIARILGNIGPAAKEAVPILIDFVDRVPAGSPEQGAAKNALREITK